MARRGNRGGRCCSGATASKPGRRIPDGFEIVLGSCIRFSVFEFGCRGFTVELKSRRKVSYVLVAAMCPSQVSVYVQALFWREGTWEVHCHVVSTLWDLGWQCFESVGYVKWLEIGSNIKASLNLTNLQNSHGFRGVRDSVGGSLEQRDVKTL